MAYRARAAGDALKLRKLQEKKYDEENEAGTIVCLVDWINATVNGDHPKMLLEEIAEPSGTGVNWRKLQFHLRDGVVLCKLINVLLKSDNKTEVKCNPTNATSAFVALENIKEFNRGVQDYGVAAELSFDSKDLYEVVKAPFVNVITCIKELARFASSKDFQPSCEIKTSIAADQNNVEKT